MAKLQFTAQSEALDGNGRSPIFQATGYESVSLGDDKMGRLSLNRGGDGPPESDITGRAKGSDTPEALGRHFWNSSRGGKR